MKAFFRLHKPGISFYKTSNADCSVIESLFRCDAANENEPKMMKVEQKESTARKRAMQPLALASCQPCANAPQQEQDPTGAI